MILGNADKFKEAIQNNLAMLDRMAGNLFLKAA